MFEVITHNLLWQEGLQIVLVLATLVGIGFIFYKPLAYASLGFFLFSLYFFRSPERVCPQALQDTAVLVCPADGKIVDVQYDPQAGFDGYAYKISTFLSPFDAHVNWVPTPGVVEKIAYRAGTFSLAFLPKSSELNERNDVIIRHASGSTLLVRQIAGTIARRICCWVKEQEAVEQGQKYGMIRFGSRVDTLLPANVDVAVAVGQRVYGGQTVLARWRV